MDSSIGLSFKSNFNFALVEHLIKGFRHQLVQSTVAREIRVLSILLNIVSKSESHYKSKVTLTSVPYLTEISNDVEEVRTDCPVKHRSIIVPSITNSNSSTNILASNYPSIAIVYPLPQSHSSTSITDFIGTGESLPSSSALTSPQMNSTLLNVQQGLFLQRQKSWDVSFTDKTRKIGGILAVITTRLLVVPSHTPHWHSFDIEHAVLLILTKPASILVQLQQVKHVVPTIAVTPQTSSETQQSPQVKRKIYFKSFTVLQQNPDNAELCVNCLEVMIETCLSSLDEHEDGSKSGFNSGNCLIGNNGTRHTSIHHHHHHYYSAPSAAA
ncbi:unnamed protein product, partial [Rotaria sp. Silwood2]